MNVVIIIGGKIGSMKFARLIVGVALVILAFLVSQNYLHSKLVIDDNVKSKDNLMIIAHPDDESLWGGAHLAEGNYAVVCVTCGIDENREKEFEGAMAEFDNTYIALGYVDKTNGKRDDWSSCYKNIKEDLREVIESKDWNVIVTHNPDGEYGHIHHMMVSEMTTEISNKDKLFYFDKYYSKEDLAKIDSSKLESINKEELENKMRLLDHYVSQGDIVNNHIQTIIYEDFIPYEEWDEKK